MGFFKKLKARVFALDIDKIQKKSNDKKQDQLELSKQNQQKLSEKQIKTLEKKKSQLEQKLSKTREKSRQINKYIAGLTKSSLSFSDSIKQMQSRHNEIDEDFFEDLEETLIMGDISYALVSNLIDEIKKTVKVENIKDPKLIGEIIADKIFTLYTSGSVVDTTLNIVKNEKNIVLIVGVNGSGKTTTIGKLGDQLTTKGFKVLIAAADTFRAGAVDQLAIWAKRTKIPLIKPNKPNADPGSVVFEALKVFEQDDYDVLLIDTAGRLQNKTNLMQELKKIYQIIKRKFPNAPQESLLVLDATTGQNGVLQAKVFQEIAHLTGVVLTKMDGTSKGGIILTIKDQLNLGVKYIGLGEKINDLIEFDLDAFIYGLTKGLIDES